MGHCYSLDLRVRVTAFVEAGRSCRVAAQHFGVSDSFAIKLVQRTRHFGSSAPARQGRPPGCGQLVSYETSLIQTVEAKPAITMPELAARLLEEHGLVHRHLGEEPMNIESNDPHLQLLLGCITSGVKRHRRLAPCLGRTTPRFTDTK
jgi:transposase